MRWISFIGGVLFGGLVCLILGLLLGGDLGRASVYSDLCGYDAILDIEDENAREAVCDFLRSN